MTVANRDSVQGRVQEYYGKVLKGSGDLKTSACCSTNGMPTRYKEILRSIDAEILERFYGCGSPIPPALEGCTVLDLGCGTGRDVYLASRLVGPDGFVIGVDMTGEQLEVARRHLSGQMERFGYLRPNVDFRQGAMEDLKSLGIRDASVDVVISNCVINLSPHKDRVFAEVFRVLKPGGELFFSDVLADRRLPAALLDDPVLLGECLAGAMYYEDFRRMLARLGCPDPRMAATSPIRIENAEVEAKIGMAKFFSLTIRAFKLAAMEDRCEDYGQVATYLGSLPDWPHFFSLDDHHEFVTGKPMLVCGNTAAMLSETRYAQHFQVIGNRRAHFGLFDCSPSGGRVDSSSAPGGCC